MNLIKATIATAAVLTCCMGNEMPANAQASFREKKVFEQGYEYGYSYGMLAESCVMFMFGHVSEERLAQSARYVRDSEDLLPQWKKAIANNFQEMANDENETSVCNPIVQRVLNPARQRRLGNTQRADYLY